MLGLVTLFAVGCGGDPPATIGATHEAVTIAPPVLPASLALTGAGVIETGACEPYVVTVYGVDRTGATIKVKVTAPLTVALTGAAGFFSDSHCQQALGGLATVAAATNHVKVFFANPAAAALTLHASSTGLAGGDRAVVVADAGPAVGLSISGPAALISDVTCGAYTVTLRDANGFVAVPRAVATSIAITDGPASALFDMGGPIFNAGGACTGANGNQLSIAAGRTSARFSFIASGPGSGSVVASAAGLAPATKAIRNSVPTHLLVGDLTLGAGSCVGFSIRTADDYGRIMVVSPALPILLTASGLGELYTDPTCSGSPIDTGTIADLHSRLDLWFRDPVAETVTVAASAPDLASGVTVTATFTVVTPDRLVLRVSPPSIRAGDCRYVWVESWQGTARQIPVAVDTPIAVGQSRTGHFYPTTNCSGAPVDQLVLPAMSGSLWASFRQDTVADPFGFERNVLTATDPSGALAGDSLNATIYTDTTAVAITVHQRDPAQAGDCVGFDLGFVDSAGRPATLAAPTTVGFTLAPAGEAALYSDGCVTPIVVPGQNLGVAGGSTGTAVFLRAPYPQTITLGAIARMRGTGGVTLTSSATAQVRVSGRVLVTDLGNLRTFIVGECDPFTIELADANDLAIAARADLALAVTGLGHAGTYADAGCQHPTSTTVTVPAGAHRVTFYLSDDYAEDLHLLFTSGPWSSVAAYVAAVVVLGRITVVPDVVELMVGNGVLLTVRGYVSGGAVVDLAPSRTSWSVETSGGQVVTIDDLRYLRAVAPGRAVVTAHYGAFVWQVFVEVIPRTVALTFDPAPITVSSGESASFRIDGQTADGSTFQFDGARPDLRLATVTSSNDTVAAVEVELLPLAPSNWLVVGHTAGSVVLTATFTDSSGEAVSGEVPVTVTSTITSLTIDPATASAPLGQPLGLAVTARHADGSTADVTALATWTSSDPAVAAVSAPGVADTVAVGHATITATIGPLSASAPVVVLPPTLSSLAITGSSALVTGTSAQLTAIGTYSDGTTRDVTGEVTWSSSGPAAIVSNPRAGFVYGVSSGQVAVTAQLDGRQSTVAISVAQLVITPNLGALAPGATRQMTATLVAKGNQVTDVTDLVAWTSSDPTVATVSATGLVTGVGSGRTIVAAAHPAFTGSAGLSVIVGAAPNLTSLAITPLAPSMARGGVVELRAIGTAAGGATYDVTGDLQWVVANGAILSNPGPGAFVGLQTGASLVTARIPAPPGFPSPLSASTTVTVVAPPVTKITLSEPYLFAPLGATAALRATARYADGATADVTSAATWASSDVGVAIAGDPAAIAGVGPGTAAITATLGGVTGAMRYDVGASSLAAMEIYPDGLAAHPNNATVTGRQSIAFVAVGTCADGSLISLTELTDWSADNAVIASVGNLPGSKGLVRGASATTSGVTLVVATVDGGLLAMRPLAVLPATLLSITVSPANPTIFRNQVTPFTASAAWSDGFTDDVTASALWTSSDPTICQVVAPGQVKGLISFQSCTITAAFAGSAGSTTVTVGLGG